MYRIQYQQAELYWSALSQHFEFNRPNVVMTVLLVVVYLLLQDLRSLHIAYNSLVAGNLYDIHSRESCRFSLERLDNSKTGLLMLARWLIMISEADGHSESK